MIREKYFGYIVIKIVLISLAICLGCTTAGEPAKDKTGSPGAVRLIIEIEAEGVDKDTKNSVEQLFIKGLTERKGASYIIHRQTHGAAKSGNRVLIGSVSRLGSGFFLSAKVVDGEKGKVLFNKSIVVNSKGDMKGRIDDISEDISKEKAIWR